MEAKTSLNKKFLIIRISEHRKKKWKQFSKERGISLTDLIVNAVEKKMLVSERREVLKFIESQDNIFAKIENNINQFARVANSKKMVHPYQMEAFLEKLEAIQKLKTEQNLIFKNIYKLIAIDDDSENS